MNLEGLLTNIFQSYYFIRILEISRLFVNKERINKRNNEILLDTSTIGKEKFQYNNYHDNNPVT
jgi:hypothetical protein